MKILKGIWNFLIASEKIIMIVASILIAVLVFATVVMRYILKISFSGMEEIVLYTAMWIYFMGGAFGSFEESHITADILSVFIKNDTGLKVLKFIRSLISMLILFIASYCCIGFESYAFQAGSATTIMRIPMFIIYIPIILGIALMNLYAIYHSVRHGMALFGKKRGAEA